MEQEKGENTQRQRGEEDQEELDREIPKERQEEDREPQNETDEQKREAVQTETSEQNGEVPSTQNEALEDIMPQLLEMETTMKETVGMNSNDNPVDGRSRSQKKHSRVVDQSPGTSSPSKCQSPRGKADGANHKSQSPRSESESPDRRTWLQERSVPGNSASSRRSRSKFKSRSRSRSSSQSSGSTEGRFSRGKYEGKKSRNKSHDSEKIHNYRHRSQSSRSSESHERHSYYKGKSDAHKRSSSRHRSQSSVRSKSDRHTHKKHDKSDSEQRRSSSDDESDSPSRPKSKRDSYDKHQRSAKSERSHSASRTHDRSRSDRRSSSTHHSPSSKRKRSTSGHRSYTRSRSQSPRHSRTEHRSSHESSPKSSHERSPTSDKKKSQSKSKSEKHSQAKRKSSHNRSSSHGKKSKRHHKKSKSSNKSKSNKHSGNKAKSSHHKSATSRKQHKQSRQSSRSSDRGRSNSADRSSAEEKYHRHRSHTPPGRFNYSYYKMESPRNRSTSPDSCMYQQRRQPQYGPQGQYGRAGFSHYMKQAPGRYNTNYRRGAWTGQQQNFNQRNQQRWIPNNNNNNNRNRIGFYRRPGWNNNNLKNNYQNNRNNMPGYQRGRFQQQWSHGNTNYQNRQQQPRRWQSPLGYGQGRNYQPRPYSPSSWEGSSADSPTRHKSRRQTSSISPSPPPKKHRKASSSSASPVRSPTPAPKPTKSLASKHPPHRSPSVSTVDQSRSASECSGKKASPVRSSPASPVELQNLRVVVDNVPAEDEEESAMSEESESQSSESAVPSKKTQYIRNSSSEVDQQSTDSVVSVKDHMEGHTLRKKTMPVAVQNATNKYHSQPVKISPKSGPKYAGYYNSSEEDEDNNAAGGMSDSAREEGVQTAAAHSMSASPDDTDIEMPPQMMSDNDIENSDVEIVNPDMAEDSDDDEDVAEANPLITDSSEESNGEEVAHSMSDSSHGGHISIAAYRKKQHHKNISALSRPDVCSPKYKARLLNKTQPRFNTLGKVHPIKKARVSGNASPSEKHVSATRLHPLSKRKWYQKSQEYVKSSSGSESDEYWTSVPMKFKGQDHKCKYICPCSIHPNHSCSVPLIKQSKNSWTQTNLSDCFLTEDEEDICVRKKRKKVTRTGHSLPSDANAQPSHRLSRGTEAMTKASNCNEKPKIKDNSLRLEKARNLCRSSSSDDDTQPSLLSTGRQTKKTKNMSLYSAQSKIKDKKPLDQGSRREHLQKHKDLLKHMSSYPSSDVKTSQSSKKRCTENSFKRSHSSHHHGTVASETPSTKQEVKRKTPQKCDASSLILDISSVPLPSECEQPKKAPAGKGVSDSCKEGNKQANTKETQSMTNNQQKSSAVHESSVLTSQNRIYKKAWQSTVSVDSSKKGHNAESAKSTDSALHQPEMSQNESQKLKNHDKSSSKPQEVSTQQENHSEAFTVPGNTVAKMREAKPSSALTTETNEPNDKHISVKINSAKTIQRLTKKVSLSSGSSEENKSKTPVGHAKKTGKCHNRFDSPKSKLKGDEDENHEQPGISKPKVKKPRTNESQIMNNSKPARTNTSSRYSRTSNSNSNFDDYKSASQHAGVKIHGHVQEGKPNKSRTREENELRGEASVKSISQDKHSKFSKFDACRPDPLNEEEEIFKEESVQEINVDMPITKEGKIIKKRTTAKTGIPEREKCCYSNTNNSLSASKTRQKGEKAVAEQQNMHKLKMARQRKEMKSGLAVKNKVPSKQYKHTSSSGRLDSSRAEPVDEDEESYEEQDEHERILMIRSTKRLEMKRKMAMKNNSPDKRLKACRTSNRLDTCQPETEDETQVQQNARTQKTNKTRMKGGQAMKRGTTVKDCASRKHTPGSIASSKHIPRLRKPKDIKNEIVQYPNMREYMGEKLKTKGQEIKKGAGLKNSGSTGPNSGLDTSRCGLKQKEKEVQEYAGVQKPKTDRSKVDKDLENKNGTSDKNSSDSEMSSSDSVSKKDRDDLERKLREKLLRSLQTKKTGEIQDEPGAKTDATAGHNSTSGQ